MIIFLLKKKKESKGSFQSTSVYVMCGGRTPAEGPYDLCSSPISAIKQELFDFEQVVRCPMK